jgi:mRNA-degrading endonuclease RelE of RelBE toxin-antitoxin system
LQVSDQARKQIDELNRHDRILVFDKIVELLNANDPTGKSEVTDIKLLKEPKYEGLWRKRAGDWRILYRIENTP